MPFYLLKQCQDLNLTSFKQKCRYISLKNMSKLKTYWPVVNKDFLTITVYSFDEIEPW